MKLAKDGLPYDIDKVGSLADGEVEIIQYLRPSGKRRRMATHLGNKWAEKAQNLIISAEELRTGEIIIYVQKISQEVGQEKIGIANNESGPNSPDEILKRLIEEISG